MSFNDKHFDPKKEEEHIKEKLDYTNKWLDYHAKARDAIPEIQHMRDELEWLHVTLKNEPPGTPIRQSPLFLESPDEDWSKFTKALPLPASLFQSDYMLNTVTAVGSSTAAFNHLIQGSRSGDPTVKAYSEDRMSRYANLQQKHDQEKKVQECLSKFADKRILDRFTRARKAYYQAKSNHTEITAAALEIRTLLDGIKGVFFEKARMFPKENMTWEKMANRLARPEEDDAPTKELLRQENVRSQIKSDLSGIGKDIKKASIIDLERLWTEFLAHAFVVLNEIKL